VKILKNRKLKFYLKCVNVFPKNSLYNVNCQGLDLYYFWLFVAYKLSSLTTIFSLGRISIRMGLMRNRLRTWNRNSLIGKGPKPEKKREDEMNWWSVEATQADAGAQAADHSIRLSEGRGDGRGA
jgi:hypothetical protein